MSQKIGSQINNSGLIFSYDVADINSFKGEPTTNLINSATLSDEITWVNAGSWTFNNNETDVPKPNIPGFNTTPYRVISGTNTTSGGGGSIHFGVGQNNSLTPSRTYTMSTYYRQNMRGDGIQPYLRTVVNNNSLGNFSYNGDTNAANWPINEWIRITATATIQSNETGLYLSNYITGNYYNKIWYFGQQLEEKDHVTPLVAGSRSSTQSLLDVASGKTINLANVSFDSTGNMIFDGTNDYISSPSNTDFAFGTESFTLEVMIYPQSFSNYTHMIAFPNQSISALKANVSDGAIYYYNPSFSTYGSTPGWTLTLNTWNHVVLVRSGTIANCYLNGVLKGSVDGFSQPFTTQEMNIGWGWGSEFTAKKINAVKVYKRALSTAEVLSNYNNYKNRFSI